MVAAASNEAGAMTGFLGLGMANAVGMPAIQEVIGMQQQVPAGNAIQQQQEGGAWICECGSESMGRFCPECGKPSLGADKWQCECGSMNEGKFCPETVEDPTPRIN